MAIKYLKPLSLKNQPVLLRLDLNVPVENGRVMDDFRIRQSLPTIHLLQKGRNKIIITAHLGRPEGKTKKDLSLLPVARHLADLLGRKFIETDFKLPDYQIPHLIFYTGDIREAKHRAQIKKIPAKDIVVLENIRFYPEEEESKAAFAKQLAGLADSYVNDAFGVDHHPAVSVTGVAGLLPSYAGLLLEREIKSMEAVLHHHQSPFVIMTGGLKLSEKIGALENLGKMADKILVGGAVASLIFKAKGLEVGKSKIEKQDLKIAFEVEKNFKDKIMLPVDVVVADEKMDKRSIRATTPYEVGKKEMILDIGPKTILLFANELKIARTIVWSGPMGHFEVRPFHNGTIALARIVGAVGKRKAYALVGGGETVDAVIQSGQFEHIDHVSTGGGAMLDYLAGKKLPGIEALK